MLALEDENLRVSRRLCAEFKNKGTFNGYRILIIQHLFEDTLEWIEHLSSCIKIQCIIGKEYSNNAKVVSSLKKIGYKVLTPNYEKLDELFHLDLVIETLKECKKTGEKLIIHEIGGYCAPILDMIPKDLQAYFAGIVEDTTFGLNKYHQMELNYPIYHVARSGLKEFEVHFVGEAVVLALNRLLRSFGVSLSGKRAMVIGYGMIGHSVARFLEKADMLVSVFDIDHTRILEAYFNGYIIGSKKTLLSEADIIIAATGFNCVHRNDFPIMKDGVILASAGSRDIEFDLSALENCSSSSKTLRNYVEKFVIGGKSIFVLNKGVALNFLEQSIPSEISDLVFSEILLCCREVTNTSKIGLMTLGSESLDHISRLWLEENDLLQRLSE